MLFIPSQTVLCSKVAPENLQTVQKRTSLIFYHYIIWTSTAGFTDQQVQQIQSSSRTSPKEHKDPAHTVRHKQSKFTPLGKTSSFIVSLECIQCMPQVSYFIWNFSKRVILNQVSPWKQSRAGRNSLNEFTIYPAWACRPKPLSLYRPFLAVKPSFIRLQDQVL